MKPEAERVIRFYRLEEDERDTWARALARDLRRQDEIAAVVSFVLARRGLALTPEERADDEDRAAFLETSAEQYAHTNDLEWVGSRDELGEHLMLRLDEIEREGETA